MPPLGTRAVVITGGGTGIGRAVALRLVAGGGRAVVCGRRAEPLEALARLHPDALFPLVADVTLPDTAARLFEEAHARLGPIDGFVHSAGMVTHQSPLHISEEALRQQLEVNLVAPLRLGEEALRRLEPGGGMVFVSSTLAVRPLATTAVYSAAKAGLEQAARALALVGAPRSVRVNCVRPGPVDTEMIRTPRLAPGEAPPVGEALEQRLADQLGALGALHPLGRLGTAEEVAETIVHLLSASWMTGSSVTLDGGLLLRE